MLIEPVPNEAAAGALPFVWKGLVAISGATAAATKGFVDGTAPKLGGMLGKTGGFWAGDEPRTGPNKFPCTLLAEVTEELSSLSNSARAA